MSEPAVQWVPRWELLATLIPGDRLVARFPDEIPPGWTRMGDPDGHATCIYTGHVALHPEPAYLLRVRPAFQVGWTPPEETP